MVRTRTTLSSTEQVWTVQGKRIADIEWIIEECNKSLLPVLKQHGTIIRTDWTTISKEENKIQYRKLL